MDEEHKEKTRKAFEAFFIAIVNHLRIPQLVDWLERKLTKG